MDNIIDTAKLAEQIRFELTNTILPGIKYDFIKTIVIKVITVIPLINRIYPAHNIAIPAIQGIAFNSDNEVLQNMFYALLTKAMDKTQQGLSHPAFPKLLGQLSMDEIKILYIIFKGESEFQYTKKDYYTIADTNFPHISKDKLLKPLGYLASLGLVPSEAEQRGTFALSSYGISLKYFGEQFLQACLNQESEQLLHNLINEKESLDG